MTDHLDQQTLKSQVDYDPETGIFTWPLSKGKKHGGKVAGCADPRGYIRIGILKKRYWAHRLAWLYVYGEMPDCDIDHVNQNKNDTRISNLRLASRNMNNGNSGIWKTNTSGYRGVSLDKKDGKYECYIWKEDVKHHLGRFFCPKEAALRYNKEALDYFGEYASLNEVA